MDRGGSPTRDRHEWAVALDAATPTGWPEATARRVHRARRQVAGRAASARPRRATDHEHDGGRGAYGGGTQRAARVRHGALADGVEVLVRVDVGPASCSRRGGPGRRAWSSVLLHESVEGCRRAATPREAWLLTAPWLIPSVAAISRLGQVEVVAQREHLALPRGRLASASSTARRRSAASASSSAPRPRRGRLGRVPPTHGPVPQDRAGAVHDRLPQVRRCVGRPEPVPVAGAPRRRSPARPPRRGRGRAAAARRAGPAARSAGVQLLERGVGAGSASMGTSSALRGRCAHDVVTLRRRATAPAGLHAGSRFIGATLAMSGPTRARMPTASSARSSPARSPRRSCTRPRPPSRFRDLNPQAPTHVLVIPRSHYPNAAALAAGEPATSAAPVRRRRARSRSTRGSASGYRLVFNTGAGRAPDRLPRAHAPPRRPSDGLAPRMSASTSCRRAPHCALLAGAARPCGSAPRRPRPAGRRAGRVRPRGAPRPRPESSPPEPGGRCAPGSAGSTSDAHDVHPVAPPASAPTTTAASCSTRRSPRTRSSPASTSCRGTRTSCTT